MLSPHLTPSKPGVLECLSYSLMKESHPSFQAQHGLQHHQHGITGKRLAGLSRQGARVDRFGRNGGVLAGGEWTAGDGRGFA